MDTTETTSQSSSSSQDRMDIDSPFHTPRYHNLYADDIVPTRPVSEMTPTQTTTVPPPQQGLAPGEYPSPVPFSLHPEPVRPSAPTPQSPEPVITSSSEPVTVTIGEENAVLRRVCDTLDGALAEWDAHVTDFDKDNSPSMEAIALNIPGYISERIIYGRRPGKQRYWEGDLTIWPGHSHVVKLLPKYGEPCIYGVPIGVIEGFRYEDGAHVFYGQDQQMWVHPACSWGFREGEWEIFTVKGGLNLREFSSNVEIDDSTFKRRRVS
jgi:hypothetical protein